MTPEKRNCQNCRQSFPIESEDFTFYEKMRVPPPTWCPECRLVRRMVWMNHRTLYQRACDLCKKTGLSMFSPEYKGVAYCSLCWWGDTFNAQEYARSYDFSRSFFSQWHELMLAVPQRNLVVTYPTLENSEYTNHAAFLKNSYMVVCTDHNEHCAYSASINNSNDTIDSTFSMWCESCYECLDCIRCFKTFFSQDCENCSDVWFSKNCSGCADCIGCVNLQHKQYFIFNEPHTRREYEKKKRELNLQSYQAIQDVLKQSRVFWKKHPHRFYRGTHNEDVSGDIISHSKNTHESFRVTGTEDSKYCQILLDGQTKESYDYTIWGAGAELIYESVEIGYGVTNTAFSISSDGNLRDSRYCFNCFSSSNLFGCIALRNAHYCILNKQYTKEEYEEIVPRIIEHMNTRPYTDAAGRIYHYGEFFPPSFSSFAYNESMAQEYFSQEKEGAHATGMRWYEVQRRNGVYTVPVGDVPDTIIDVTDAYTREVIGCEHGQECNDQCTGAFKITALELEFYKKHQFPLPHLCPNCRHYERIRYRNPMKLWKRSCMCNASNHTHSGHCAHTFETSYAPDRPEIIYCEECYQQEVI